MKPVIINPNLTVEKSFFDFITNQDNLICRIILNGETKEGINFLAPTSKKDFISGLKTSKFIEGNDPFTQKGRETMKIGKLISKLIPEKYIERYNIKESDVEYFVNLYKSWFDTDNLEYRIVEGKDIKTWYLSTNYLKPNNKEIGTLWKSCMRHEKRQRLVELYCRNENIKMIALIVNVDGVEKVRSRAILWEEVKVISSLEELPEKIKVMDRIYSVFDSDVHLLKKWAFENGYLSKMDQNATSHLFFDVKGVATKVKCLVKLKSHLFTHYPYLDTFQFYDMKNGQFSNDEYSERWDYKLNRSDGTLRGLEEDEHQVDIDDDW